MPSTEAGVENSANKRADADGRSYLKESLYLVWEGLDITGYDSAMKYVFCGVLIAASAFAQNFSGKEALDDAIGQAIRQDQIPGAVLLIGHNGQIIYRKA